MSAYCFTTQDHNDRLNPDHHQSVGQALSIYQYIVYGMVI